MTEVLIIAMVNGPARPHADPALECDLVIAAHGASIEDAAHFHLGSVVPGDNRRLNQ